jgi:hypothetical protein
MNTSIFISRKGKKGDYLLEQCLGGLGRANNDKFALGSLSQERR